MSQFNPYLLNIAPGSLEILSTEAGADVFVEVRNQHAPVGDGSHDGAIKMEIYAGGERIYPEDELVLLDAGEQTSYVIQIPDISPGTEVCVSPTAIYVKDVDGSSQSDYELASLVDTIEGYSKPADYVDETCGTVQPPSDTINVVGCGFEEDTILVGDELDITATLENTSSTEQTVEVRFSAFGKTASTTITAPPGEYVTPDAQIVAPEYAKGDPQPVTVAYDVV